MRLGEIRNILYEVVSEDDQIVVEHETVYGGQVQNVKNLGLLIRALDTVKDLSWNELDYTSIQHIKDGYEENSTMMLSQDDFNQLNQYIVSLNEKIPLYISILDTMVDDQDEQTINLKISDSINSLEDITTLNSRLEKMLKKFQIDGQFEFKGFDKGTDWYVFLVAGLLTHQYFISCLKVAQEFCKARTEYYKSERAKLDYEASITETNKTVSEEDVEKYSEIRMNLELEKKIRGVIDDINEFNGETKESMQVKLVTATKDLVNELGEGTEFHLSLNPPEYLNETDGLLQIDYSSLPKPEKDTTKKIAPIKKK